MPKVSIIMANYNAEEYIAESIRSVLNQTYKDLELIIVDDCSTDSSVSVVKQFDDPRIKLHQNSVNSGPHISRNNALNIATGEYITILDSDDLMLKNKLKKQIDYLEKNKNCDILHSALFLFGEKKGITFIRTKDKLIRGTLFIGCPICNSTVMWRASLGLRYDESLPRAEDYNMWVQNIDKQFGGIGIPLVKRRIHKAQISSGYGLTQQLSDKINAELITKYFPELNEDDIALFEKGRARVFSDNDEFSKFDALVLNMVQNYKDPFLKSLDIERVFSHMIIKCMQRSLGAVTISPKDTLYGKKYGFSFLDKVFYGISKLRKKM